MNMKWPVQIPFWLKVKKIEFSDFAFTRNCRPNCAVKMSQFFRMLQSHIALKTVAGTNINTNLDIFVFRSVFLKASKINKTGIAKNPARCVKPAKAANNPGTRK